MHRTLIVAKLNTDDPSQLAAAFAESDATDLPHLVGVSRRTLFTFHDLYFHLVEADQDITPNLYRARSHPLYQRVHDDLARFLTPYDLDWREPKHAMATPIYAWSSEKGRER